jgi:hypothetical protein
VVAHPHRDLGACRDRARQRDRQPAVRIAVGAARQRLAIDGYRIDRQIVVEVEHDARQRRQRLERQRGVAADRARCRLDAQRQVGFLETHGELVDGALAAGGKRLAAEDGLTGGARGQQQQAGAKKQGIFHGRRFAVELERRRRRV